MVLKLSSSLIKLVLPNYMNFTKSTYLVSSILKLVVIYSFINTPLGTSGFVCVKISAIANSFYKILLLKSTTTTRYYYEIGKTNVKLYDSTGIIQNLNIPTLRKKT